MVANDNVISWVVNTFNFSSSDEVVIKGVRDALLAGFSQQAKLEREIFID